MEAILYKIFFFFFFYSIPFHPIDFRSISLHFISFHFTYFILIYQPLRALSISMSSSGETLTGTNSFEQGRKGSLLESLSSEGKGKLRDIKVLSQISGSEKSIKGGEGEEMKEIKESKELNYMKVSPSRSSSSSSLRGLGGGSVSRSKVPPTFTASFATSKKKNYSDRKSLSPPNNNNLYAASYLAMIDRSKKDSAARLIQTSFAAFIFFRRKKFEKLFAKSFLHVTVYFSILVSK